jgi:rhodanese-related sulfurtransferase
MRFLKISVFTGLLWLMTISSPVLAEPVVEVPDHIEGVTTLTAEELIELANSRDDLLIIDSRLVGDRSFGYLEDSISLSDIDTDCEALDEIASDKQSAMAFYCNGVNCGRSVRAVEQAKSCGYQSLYWFKGGIQEWMEKNYPLVVE